MKQAGGLWLPDADQHFATHFEQTGGFQLDRLARALTYVRRGDVAVDGGAHVGSWSLEMAKHFWRVYAFEPAADTYECLVANTDLVNAIIPLRIALGDKPGLVAMTWEERHAASGNTGARYMTEGDDTLVVPLDGLGLDSVALLKLDVEGAEYLALKGAERLLRASRPVVYVEVKKGFAERFNSKMEAPLRFLAELGAHEVERIKADHIFVFD